MTLSHRSNLTTSAPTVAVAPAQPTKPLAVRLGEASRISGFSRSRLYRMAGTGEIVFLKCGKAVLVEFASLEAAIQRLPRVTVKVAA